MQNEKTQQRFDVDRSALNESVAQVAQKEIDREQKGMVMMRVFEKMPANKGRGGGAVPPAPASTNILSSCETPPVVPGNSTLSASQNQTRG